MQTNLVSSGEESRRNPSTFPEHYIKLHLKSQILEELSCQARILWRLQMGAASSVTPSSTPLWANLGSAGPKVAAGTWHLSEWVFFPVKEITLRKFPHSAFQHLPTCVSFVNQPKCYLICPASWNTACSGDSRVCTAQPPLLLCAALPWKRVKTDWFGKTIKWCAFYLNACSLKVNRHRLWAGIMSSDLWEIHLLGPPNTPALAGKGEGGK